MTHELRSLKVKVKGAEKATAEYEEIVRLTGKMVVLWAQLDTYLAIALGQIVGCDKETAEIIYYTPSAFSGRLEILSNLAKHLMPEMPEKESFCRVLQKIDKFHKTRNSLIHSRPVVTVTSPYENSSVQRHEVRPSTKNLRRSFKAQTNDIQHHLNLVGNIICYLHAIGVWIQPYNRRSVRYWENTVLNT